MEQIPELLGKARRVQVIHNNTTVFLGDLFQTPTLRSLVIFRQLYISSSNLDRYRFNSTGDSLVLHF